MGLCGGETKARRKSGKTIIIPKGFIDPERETVIEIPLHLDANSSLIVKAPMDTGSALTVEALNRTSDSSSSSSSTMHHQRQSQKQFNPLYDRPMTSHLPLNTSHDFSFGAPLASSSAIRLLPEDRLPPEPFPPLPHLCSTCSRHVASRSFASNLDATNLVPRQSFGAVQHSFDADPLMSGSGCPMCVSRGTSVPPDAGCSRSSHFSDHSHHGASCASSRYMASLSKYQSSPDPGEYRSSRSSESAMLNKMMEEKIDKILKPVLLTLAKTYSEEEERNSYRSDRSRRGGRRGPDLDSSSFETGSWWRCDDYDNPESSRYSNKMRCKSPYEDSKSSVCTPHGGCSYKRQTVNFDDWMDSDATKRTQLNDTSSERSFELPRRETNSSEVLRRKSR